MPIPSGNVPESNLDASSDNPDSARANLLTLVQQFNQLVAAVGQNDGIAELGAGGKVPDAQLGRGESNGVASLGSDGRIPANQIPASEAGGALSVNVTEDGYTGSHDRGVEDIAFGVTTGSSGVTLNVTITYYDRTV